MTGDGRLGLESNLYRRSGGTFAEPVFTEVGIVSGDVSQTIQRAMGEIRSRGSAWVKSRRGLKSFSASFPVNNKRGDGHLEAFRSAWMDGTTVGLWFADGESDEDETKGLHADFEVTGFDKAEPLEGAETYTVTVALSDHSANEPEILEGSAE